MTRREKLMAQYEDALFALIMDEVAEAEGRIAIEENQRLKESGEVEIPAEMSRRCKRTILRKTSENNIKRYGKGVGKVLNKVAIVALMAVFLFTTAFAASDSFRVKTLNFVMEVFDDRTEIRFVPENVDFADNRAAVPQIAAGWLPQGFELTREDVFEAYRVYEYTDSDGTAYITVSIMEMTGVSMVIDTENATTLSRQVQGMDAMMVNKGKTKQLIWQLQTDENWYCCILAENISEEDMLRFADNISVK